MKYKPKSRRSTSSEAKRTGKRTIQSNTRSRKALREGNKSGKSNLRGRTIPKNFPVKKQIIVRRSSGREEKFDTNRLAQTISRSGVPYPMARDIAKKTTKRIRSRIKTTRIDKAVRRKSKNLQRKSGAKRSKPVIVTASQVRNLVASELKERNRPDIASSYLGNPPDHVDQQTKPNLDDKEPVLDKVAANRSRVLFDPSKQKGGA